MSTLSTMQVPKQQANIIDTSGWSFGGDTPNAVRAGIAGLLKQHNVRLADLFRQLDDGDTALSLSEFKDAFAKLGYTGKTAVVEDIFKRLDQDCSREVSFNEFNVFVADGFVRPEDRAASLSLVPRLRASFEAGDDAWSPSRLQWQLGAALAAEGLRPVDLLKAWDAPRNGERDDNATKTKVKRAGAGDDVVSKKEFLIGMKRVCGGSDLWYTMAREAANEAFAKIDLGGDRKISRGELIKWLDPNGRLLAQGRMASQRQLLPRQPSQVRSESAKGEEDEEEQQEEEDSMAYSPTKLSTRLATVRAFDPDLKQTKAAAVSRGRTGPPLWTPKHAVVPVSAMGGLPRRRNRMPASETPPPTTAAHLVPRPLGSPLSLEDIVKGVDKQGRALAAADLEMHRPAPIVTSDEAVLVAGRSEMIKQCASSHSPSSSSPTSLIDGPGSGTAEWSKSDLGKRTQPTPNASSTTSTTSSVSSSPRSSLASSSDVAIVEIKPIVNTGGSNSVPTLSVRGGRGTPLSGTTPRANESRPASAPFRAKAGWRAERCETETAARSRWASSEELRLPKIRGV